MRRRSKFGHDPTIVAATSADFWPNSTDKWFAEKGRFPNCYICITDGGRHRVRDADAQRLWSRVHSDMAVTKHRWSLPM